MIIGYDINTIIKIINKLDLDKIKINFDLDSLIESFGIDNGSRIIAMIQTLIFNKLELYDITFKQFYEITQKDLKIISLNYTQKKEVLLSYETTPDMSVILAIRMSISIPFIFTPVKYKNELYVDGGLINNFGLEYCNIENTIGICLSFNMRNNTAQLDNIFEYLCGLICAVMKTLTIKRYHHDNIIILDSEWMNIAKFNLNKKYKLLLFKHGYNKTKNICNNSINFIARQIVNNSIDNAINIIMNN